MPDDKISELPLVPSGTPSKATDEAVVNFRNPDGSFTTMRDTFAKMKAFFSGDKENTGVAQLLIDSHEAQLNPHPQYINSVLNLYDTYKYFRQGQNILIEVPQMGKVYTFNVNTDPYVTFDHQWLIDNELLGQYIFSIFNNSSTSNVTLLCGLNTYLNTFNNTSDTSVEIKPKQSALFYRESNGGSPLTYTVFLNKETSNGGIPEPTANGNWLRTNLGTWVEGVLLSTYNANVNTLKHAVKYGEAITKGQAVYASSADGTNIVVSLASNATEATSSKTLGLAVTTGALNAISEVITDGFLGGLNTSTATLGDPVWLGVGGNLIYGLTNKPIAPAHLVYIGVVTRVSATVGEILVKVQNGFELKEIHDVLLGTLVNNDVLVYESSTGLWKNKQLDTSMVATSTNKRFVTDAQLTVISNTSNTNSGDETNATIKTKLGVDLTNKVLVSDKATYDQYIEGISDKWIDAVAYKRLWDYSHVTGKAFTKNVFSRGWTSVSFQNGYSNFDGGYQTAQFRKIENNMVQFRGLIKKTTTVTAGETIFTLPLGCRPAQQVYLSAFVFDGTSVFRPAGIFILTDGTVNLGKDNSWSTMTFMSIELQFVASKYNLTIIGDSITVGQGATTPSTGGYAPRLANLLNASLVNRGIGGVLLQNSIGNTGNGANNIRDRYVSDVHPNQSDVIIIAGGVNDVFLNNSSVTALAYKNNIKEMIALSVQAGYNKRSIIVLTPFYVKPSQYAISSAPFNGGSLVRHQDFVKAAIDAVKETGAFYLDIYTAMLNGGGDSLITSDGVHPNDAGHTFIAQYLYDYMC